MRDYFARRYSPANIVLAFAGKTDWDQLVDLATSALRRLGRAAPAPAQAVPPAGPGAFQAILRAEDQQQTVIGVADGPPLESDDRYAAQLLATDPRRPHRLAALLGPDRPRPRRRRRALVPGLQPGRRLLHLPELRARARPRPTSAGSPRSTATVMAEGVTEDELTQAKNKVLARSVLRSERPMGRLASLGFHWTYRREYLSVEDELEAFSRVTLDDLRRVLDDWPLLPMTDRLRRARRPRSIRRSETSFPGQGQGPPTTLHQRLVVLDQPLPLGPVEVRVLPVRGNRRQPEVGIDRGQAVRDCR